MELTWHVWLLQRTCHCNIAVSTTAELQHQPGSRNSQTELGFGNGPIDGRFSELEINGGIYQMPQYTLGQGYKPFERRMYSGGIATFYVGSPFYE